MNINDDDNVRSLAGAALSMEAILYKTSFNPTHMNSPFDTENVQTRLLQGLDTGTNVARGRPGKWQSTTGATSSSGLAVI